VLGVNGRVGRDEDNRANRRDLYLSNDNDSGALD
jgi:hypothetical protein